MQPIQQTLSRGQVMRLLTMVFTDVVESSVTKRDASLGRDDRERDHAYLEKVQTHHFELIRRCCRYHKGQEVNTMGDAFFLAFDDPVEAVRCAVGIQQRLAANPIETPKGPLRLRIGIHSGFPEFFESSWHGTDVDATARVESAASAQQVLLSSRTYELVRHMTDVKFYPHGEFALKGVERIAVWEVDWTGKGPRPTSIPAIATQQRARRRQGALALLAGLALLAVSIGYRFYAIRKAREAAGLPATVSVRRSVAVLGFKNVSGRPDQAWVATALSDMLTTELAAGGQLRTIPGENVAEMKISLSLPDAESYGQETLKKIHKNLNADDVVVGSYLPLGKGKIRVDLRLQDTVGGEVLTAVSEKGDETEIDDLVSRAGAELRARLGAGSVSTVEAAEVRAALSGSSEAEKLYSEGLAHLRVFDNLKARDLLQKATEVDPNFALAHSALASAWKGLGYDKKAKDEALRAFDLSAGLRREDRLRVEGQYREMANEFDKAVEIYRTLFQFFPDNLEYGVLLAKSQTQGGKGKDALATVEALNKLPQSVVHDPRMDLEAAEASYYLGDFKQAQSFAVRAADTAKASGARLTLARALYLQARALEDMGSTKDASDAIEEARTIYTAAGDRYRLGSAFEISGRVKEDEGDLPGAIAQYTQELAIAREVGSKRAEASALNNLGVVLNQQNELSAAKKMWERSLANFREIDDRYNSAMVLLNIGVVLQAEGDLAGAKKVFEQALSMSREVNDKNGISLSLNALGTVLDAQGEFASAKEMLDQAITIDLENGRKTSSADKLVSLGDLLQHQGDLRGAAKSYQDGLELSRKTGDKSNAGYALFGLGNLAITGADFSSAKKYFDEALSLRNELGEKQNVDATRVALAALALEQGFTNQAVVSLREMRSGLHRAKRFELEIWATCLLTRALLAQGNLPEAQRDLKDLAEAIRMNQSIEGRLNFVIADALVQAASGNISAAKVTLSAALAEAARVSFLSYEFEARLALAEVEIKAGLAAEPHTRLGKLETDARARGYELVAQKAATARNR